MADLEERNRDLERSLADTRERLEATVGHLGREIRRRIAINRSLESALQNLRNVLDKSASGVIIVDHEGITRYVNAVTAEMLGRNKTEMIGELFGLPLSKDDVDLDLVREDGTRAVANMRVIPTVWEGENAQLILLQDVTTQKRQELELKTVNRALNAVYRCSEIIVRSQDETVLLNGVCQSLVRNGGYAMVWAGLLEADSVNLVPVARASRRRRPVKDALVERETTCGHVREALENGQVSAANRTECEGAARLGCDSVATVPLIWAGRSMGVLTIYSSGASAFGTEELRMLWRLADDLSYGLASLRTQAERHRIQESLHSLSARLVQLQEEERRSIARELHDEIGQSLTGIKIALDRTTQSCQTCRPDLTQISSEVVGLIEQVRNLSLSLRPTMLDDLGLLATLRWHLGRYTSQTGVKVHFKRGRLPRNLPHDVVTTAYRIVQEALTNVARHARTSEVMVSLRTDGHVLRMEVKDDGVGFDLDRLPETGGVGLGGMRERVIAAGGSLTIESRPGCGTYILAELPLPENGPATNRRKQK